MIADSLCGSIESSSLWMLSSQLLSRLSLSERYCHKNAMEIYHHWVQKRYHNDCGLYLQCNRIITKNAIIISIITTPIITIREICHWVLNRYHNESGLKLGSDRYPKSNRLKQNTVQINLNCCPKKLKISYMPQKFCCAQITEGVGVRNEK